MTEVGWAGLVAQPAAALQASAWVARLLALLQRAIDFTLPVLSRPQVRMDGGTRYCVVGKDPSCRAAVHRIRHPSSSSRLA